MAGKKLVRLMGVGLISCLMAMPAAGSALAVEKKIQWKGQSCFGVASPLGQHTIVLWQTVVEQMSGGRMQITLHDAGEIVPPTKIYDAVKDGLLDFGLNLSLIHI